MSRRLLLALFFVGLASLAAPYAYAATHVIGQASTSRYEGSVYLSRALTPGHVYRIDVLASGHKAFFGHGFENFLAVARGRLEEGTKPITLKGTTPRSFIVKQPPAASLREWLLAASVQVKSASKLTLRFVDLGRGK